MQVDADPAVCDPDGPGNRENQAEVAKAMHPAHRSIANRSYRHGIRLHFCTFQAGDKDCRFGTVCSHSAARRRGVSPVRNNCSDFCGETDVVPARRPGTHMGSCGSPVFRGKVSLVAAAVRCNRMSCARTFLAPAAAGAGFVFAGALLLTPGEGHPIGRYKARQSAHGCDGRAFATPPGVSRTFPPSKAGGFAA